MKTIPTAAAALALLAAPAWAQPPVPVPGDPGRTTLDVSRDPIDDSVRAFVTYRSGDSRLAIGCDVDRFRGIRIYLGDRGWFAPSSIFGRRRTVRWRFDTARPRRASWRADEGDLYLKTPSRVRNFLRWLLVSERVAMRARDVEERERDQIFMVAGSRPEIEHMLEACGERDLGRALFGRPEG